MKTLIIAVLAATSLTAASALAQTSLPAAAPTAATPAVTEPTQAMTKGVSLTDQQAKDWIDKAVYSSDSKKLGEVAAFARDATGGVTEMHADVGGYFGLGETRIRLMPAQFKLMTDRVVLSMTADQAKSLPTVTK